MSMNESNHSLSSNAAEYSTTTGQIEVENPKMSMRNVDVSYGDKQALFDINMDIF